MRLLIRIVKSIADFIINRKKKFKEIRSLYFFSLS